ncbi:MAG: hypothetical protein HFI12_07155 [Lachnospiraceae bacterium]|nr:hypothetical protein [Lachnospiraceae bacterium]
MGRKRSVQLAVLLAVVVCFSAMGPERIARYKDRSLLNEITVEEKEDSSNGYRYQMNSNERLYLLSECLSHQLLPESEQSAKIRENSSGLDYEDFAGTYAFVMNRQGPSEREITDAQIYEICNRELEELKRLGILPEDVKEVDTLSYSAVLYSAIDVLEPQNNMPVWRVSLSTKQQNTNKANRLIDLYLDAQTGKVYSFYARTEKSWEELEPENIIKQWESYLGLTGKEEYLSDNPLLETTSNYKKYRFPGMDEGTTIVTIGFYEGIHELFIKVTS